MSCWGQEEASPPRSRRRGIYTLLQLHFQAVIDLSAVCSMLGFLCHHWQTWFLAWWLLNLEAHNSSSRCWNRQHPLCSKRSVLKLSGIVSCVSAVTMKEASVAKRKINLVWNAKNPLDSPHTKGCLERTNLCIHTPFMKGFSWHKGNTSKAAETCSISCISNDYWSLNLGAWLALGTIYFFPFFFFLFI